MLRLVYFDSECRRDRLEIADIGHRLQVIAVVCSAKCRGGIVREEHAPVLRRYRCQREVLQGDVAAVARRLEPAREECVPLNRGSISSPGMKEVGFLAFGRDAGGSGPG